MPWIGPATMPPRIHMPTTSPLVRALGLHLLLLLAGWQAVANRALAADAPAPQPPRGRIIHPDPVIRHATPRYEAEFPGAISSTEFLKLVDRPLPGAGLHLQEAPLRDLCSWALDTLNLTVDIDHRALEEIGLDADTPVTAFIDEGTLGTVLARVLEPLDLTIIPDRGGYLLTSIERASTHLVVGLYPLPLGTRDTRALMDIVQSSVAAETWDAVGGPASIRAHDDLSQLVVSQTIDVHREMLGLMRSLDAFDPGAAGDAAAGLPARPHELRTPGLARELSTSLVGLCNDALGPLADPDARVSVVAGRLVVQSRSRPFQVYAGELVRAFDGVEVAVPPSPPAEP